MFKETTTDLKYPSFQDSWISFHCPTLQAYWEEIYSSGPLDVLRAGCWYMSAQGAGSPAMEGRREKGRKLVSTLFPPGKGKPRHTVHTLVFTNPRPKEWPWPWGKKNTAHINGLRLLTWLLTGPPPSTTENWVPSVDLENRWDAACFLGWQRRQGSNRKLSDEDHDRLMTHLLLRHKGYRGHTLREIGQDLGIHPRTVARWDPYGKRGAEGKKEEREHRRYRLIVQSAEQEEAGDLEGMLRTEGRLERMDQAGKVIRSAP